jgi:hypothetical protein
MTPGFTQPLTNEYQKDRKHEECLENIAGKARRKETTRKTKKPRSVDNIKIYLILV